MADHSSGGDPQRPVPVSSDVVRREFTRQAETFARSLMVADLALEDMLDLADLRGDELMLDLAAGTGAVSFIFAPRVRTVIAADLTTAMLAQAAARAAREGIENVRLVLADVARLPFTDATFDLATCRIAIHHFSEPDPILQELHRVLRPDARAVICDTLTSDDPTRAALHN